MAPRIAVVTFNRVAGPQDTLKYQCLGPRAVASLEAYAARHNYAFHADVPPADGRDVCWGKIPAILNALEAHDWVLWADSDALVALPHLALEGFLGPDAVFVAQSPEPWFDLIGLRHNLGWQLQPVNTGVFLIRSCADARRVLMDSFSLGVPVAPGLRWNGRGDQEALAAVLAQGARSPINIRYVADLQRPPQRPDMTALFVHLYGNFGRFRFPEAVCRAVIDRVAGGSASGDFAAMMPLLHWCAIQNRSAANLFDRGGPERFGYSPQALDNALQAFTAENTSCFG